MTKILNRKSLKKYRRKLRKGQTRYESALWKYLRNRRLNGFRFVRQYSVGIYILDFYCPKMKLAIELDGHHHADAEYEEYDLKRTKELERFGIKVIRFWNDGIVDNLDMIIQKISEELESRFS